MAELRTKRGDVILVDDEDFMALSKPSWHVTSDGYAKRTVRIGRRSEGKKITVAIHRQILGLERGDARQVDHINGNKLDNRRCNLRICLKDENARNRKTNANNQLGYKGVSRHGLKSRVEIQSHVRRVYLGLHPTAELANEFYALAAEMLHGEFANAGN